MSSNNISYLDVRDLLSIEFIRLNNIHLYNSIYINRKYFISHDKIVDNEIFSTSINKEKFNKSGEHFFKKLFEDPNNLKYIDLLQEMFPYVKKYKSGQELEYSGNLLMSDDSYKEIAKNKRICSGKYFDLYFTKTFNEYAAIGNLVEEYIHNVNKTQHIEKQLQILNDILKSVPKSHQQEFFDRLQLWIDNIDQESRYNFIIVLFKSILQISNDHAFFTLGARSRVEIIIWELLQSISEEQYEEFLEKIKKDYDKINNISSILYWFKHDKEGKNIEGRIDKMEYLYKQMGAEIIKNSINLYDDNYYNRGNIWGLVKLYKDDLSIVKNYIKEIITKDNIFRLLNDIIGTSIGSNIKYSISDDNLKSLTTINDIDEILKSAETKTSDQEFILKVYNNYRSDIKDDWGETGIVSNKILHLNP